jgi:uncharacterized protein YbaR (Trm112 family)
VVSITPVLGPSSALPPHDSVGCAPIALGPCHAHVDGFDLHAGLVTGSARSTGAPLSLRVAAATCAGPAAVADGTIWLTLRRRWADGTTHLRFDPLAPRAAWRAALVAETSQGVETSHVQPSVEGDEDTSRGGPSRPGAYQWAELMRRTFGLDILACPRCAGRLRLMALIEQASVVQRILRHLGLPTEVPERRPARATRDTPGSIPGRSRIRCHLLRASRLARRGVGALRRSSSRPSFSFGFPADVAIISRTALMFPIIQGVWRRGSSWTHFQGVLPFVTGFAGGVT